MSVSRFIEDQLPARFLARMPKLFVKGHKLANQIVKDNPCLALPSLQVGDIRNAAIEFTLQEHLQLKNYAGVICEFRFYARPTGKYFQIQTTDARITISHLPFVSEFPRTAEFRKDASQANQPYLFVDLERERKRAEAEERERSIKKHLIITYGNHNLEFLQIGAPHPRLQAWLENPMDMMRRPHFEVDDEDDDMEAKESAIPMNLKDQFLKHLSENAEK